MIKVGQVIMKSLFGTVDYFGRIDAVPRRCRVVYIHPKKRFYTVRDEETGIRESFNWEDTND